MASEYDVGKDVLLDEFFTRDIWFLDWGVGGRFAGMSIKVEPSGYLAVLRLNTAEGPKVAFTGKGSLSKLANSLRSEAGRESLRWRPDKFRLDDLEKNG